MLTHPPSFYTADGKPENTFAFEGEAKSKKYATEITHECHEAWRRLITGEVSAKTASYALSIANISIQGSPGQIPTDHPLYTNIPKATRVPPKPIGASSECSGFYELPICPLVVRGVIGRAKLLSPMPFYPFLETPGRPPSIFVESKTDKSYFLLSP